MALKHFAIIFVFAVFLSSLHEIQARDNLMFNKIPSKVDEEIVVEVKQPVQNLPNKEATNPAFNPDQQKQQKEDEQQDFIPLNVENKYSMYGHGPIESGHLSPSVRTENNKYLSKNYETVPFVTQPENFNGYTNTPTNNNNHQTQVNDMNSYNAQKKDSNDDFDFMGAEDTSVNYNNKNSYYNDEFVKENNFNTRFMDTTGATNNDDDNNYFSSGKSRANRGEPEGMSDTRFMENGKYNYDINAGKYNQFNPTGNNKVDNYVQYDNYREEKPYKNEYNMP